MLIQWDSSLLEAWEHLSDLEEKVLLENGRDVTNQYLTKAKDETDSVLKFEYIPKGGKRLNIDQHEPSIRTSSCTIRSWHRDYQL